MKTKIILAVLLVAVAGGAYYYMQERAGMGAYSDAKQTEMPTVVPLTAPATMADVATHAGQSSCWTVIDGNVYDLTGWIAMHPGGERAILSLCGKDGTSTFHGQHGNNKTQADILASFKIGTVSQK